MCSFYFLKYKTCLHLNWLSWKYLQLLLSFVTKLIDLFCRPKYKHVGNKRCFLFYQKGLKHQTDNINILEGTTELFLCPRQNGGTGLFCSVMCTCGRPSVFGAPEGNLGTTGCANLSSLPTRASATHSHAGGALGSGGQPIKVT